MANPSSLKEAIKPILHRIQKDFGIIPHNLCLITGAPRSGTTALGEWLDQQPDISSFTESRILISAHRLLEETRRFNNLEKDSPLILKLVRRYVLDYYSNSRFLLGKRCLIEKEPLEPIAFPLKDYEQFLFNVRKIFPQCKFLFLIREPVATIWSMSNRRWGESLTRAEAREFTLAEYAENWRACADLILKYQADPLTYIVHYGQLIHDPMGQSREILRFLGVREGKPFEPHRTKEIGFSAEQEAQILQVVKSELEKLQLQGIKV